MKKHRIILTLISVFVLISICITVFATVGAKRPDIVSGKTENLIADRISVTAQNTEFTIKNKASAAEEYTLTIYLSAAKTQGDFYAVINSLKLSGISYDRIVFTALTDTAENKTFENLTLNAVNGTPEEYKWQIDITLTIENKGEFTPEIIIDYTSGTNKDDAQQKLMRIPLKITVE